ncbi:uncharacterized protein LOC130706627 [Balaenoptera acutorostrata]|uniref:Uncharacterized protein LOC130706627 n=1 Tax=Balaenoptera acutorostrata TaxID=9767 RepID=A0ABM3SZQ3_BALAC|nr:uncharacterized protein LOC130706627 [Balaenoptera acutorostrata]
MILLVILLCSGLILQITRLSHIYWWLNRRRSMPCLTLLFPTVTSKPSLHCATWPIENWWLSLDGRSIFQHSESRPGGQASERQENENGPSTGLLCKTPSGHSSFYQWHLPSSPSCFVLRRAIFGTSGDAGQALLLMRLGRANQTPRALLSKSSQPNAEDCDHMASSSPEGPTRVSCPRTEGQKHAERANYECHLLWWPPSCKLIQLSAFRRTSLGMQS